MSEHTPGHDAPRHGAASGASDTTRTFSPVQDVDSGQLSPDDLAAIKALPDGSALLIVSRGPNTGSRFLLDSERTSAGRHTSSEIFLDDVTVSRRHAEFVRDGASFSVRDVGSLNGTYVNRERVDGCALRSGDEVQIGRFRMTFHLHPERS
ncbi:MAG: FHA domain-containing protein [Actinomycetales bacterium]